MRHVKACNLFEADAAGFPKSAIVIEKINGDVPGDEFGEPERIDSAIAVVAVTKEEWLAIAVFRARHQLVFGRNIAQHGGGELPDGPHRSQRRLRNWPACQRLDFQQHRGCEQGIAAQLEEIIVHSEVCAAKQTLPDFEDQYFDNSCRRMNLVSPIEKLLFDLGHMRLPRLGTRQACDDVDVLWNFRRCNALKQKALQL